MSGFLIIFLIVLCQYGYNQLIYPWRDSDPETPWNIERVFNGHYKGTDFPANVNIAIIDSYIDTSLPDLQGQVKWVYDTRQIITNSCTYLNTFAHGTFIAGIIGAARDGKGIVGINPIANLYSIVTTWTETTSTVGPQTCWKFIKNGIIAAVNGPDGIAGTEDDTDIINLSYHGDNSSQLFLDYLPELHDAIKYAYNHNVVIVAPTGNINDNLLINNTVWPAAFSEVIAVGATDINDNLASFSNTGPFVEVVAPGVDIESTFNGTNIDQSCYICTKEGVVTSSGTSFAVAHVVGIISLIIAKYGKLPIGNFNDFNSSTIRGILHSTAIDLGDKGYDMKYGYGLVQFE